MLNAGLFFAAGLGTRMAPLTDNRPKPLIEVGGTTLLDHALDLGDAAGIAPQVVNIHYLPDMIATHVAHRPVRLSDERDALLETGGGLRKARPLLGPGPVFTMNTDAVWDGPNPFDMLRAGWDGGRMEALLLCVPLERALGHPGRGDFTFAADGRIDYGPGPIYTGAQIIDPAVLDEIDDDAFSMRLAWDRLIARGTCYGLTYAGRWCDVGRPECLDLAESLLR
ncbi:nucleotidyltransferase family protein [Oceanicola granulosus HTCC2516]|uniref:Nucleotidyltransferase family protein n=1 Tax=Oceanicola granulosus (strain ATCC BAA-861 / DSM 15982 / KCTC 12143 / HTCC2516) TaxID=314256 RepID=Q2CJW7_OCEGH|nr:nucleotidyltransferase family protein [Oceanicola granulosus]EAR53022.1 nucleotidyltransferase family protein [Oceanicola granulosus HTCC2516]